MRRYRLSNIPAAPKLQDLALEGLYGGRGAVPANPLVPTPPEDVLYGEEPAARASILLSRLLRAEAGPRERSRFNMVE
jgi:hypothetical protein